ncbi:hypothetical protein QQS21_004558 [Conoideocrella luteorostrata]|uniref:ribonuclease T1 n=1 Tax=Conoideocrella luteorostrata TaxID=1105319 RepID=A0AAJ0CRA8_9HYPO|nr:hypothetical protein QQS21_004558 [Conoideocrella luteorostrata]
MRAVSFITSLLLGASVSGLALAQPVDATSELLDRSSVLDIRGLDLKVKEEPKHDVKCPKTNNGPSRDYDEHKYTKGQVKAAFLGGAKLAADGKQVGRNKYPHDFGNKEKLPFKCGKDKMEFPIQFDNKVYDGGDVGNVPDRVVFEYQKKKKEFVVKFCGIMRHGPTPDFLECKD